MDITLCGGPAREFGRRIVCKGLEKALDMGTLRPRVAFLGRAWGVDERGLWEGGISLCGRSVKGTWRGGSFTGDPEGYIEEGSGDGNLSIGALMGKLEEGLIYRGHGEMDIGCLSVGAPLGDLGRGVCLLGTLRIR
jgi:hypothetical protein